MERICLNLAVNQSLPGINLTNVVEISNRVVVALAAFNLWLCHSLNQFKYKPSTIQLSICQTLFARGKLLSWVEFCRRHLAAVSVTVADSVSGSRSFSL